MDELHNIDENIERVFLRKKLISSKRFQEMPKKKTGAVCKDEQKDRHK